MPNPPVITLTTDFGLKDSYVAEMKAVLLRHCPAARLVDVTHLVPAQDVLAGSVTLERVVRAFGQAPPPSFHLAIVDPGVGTSRRLLAVSFGTALVVCPDNGLITWSWRRHSGGLAREITWRPDSGVSNTFHGRDVMAPVVGMLGAGARLDDVARAVTDPVLLDIHPAAEPLTRGRVIHVDAFGNLTTNVPEEVLARREPLNVCVGPHDLGPVRRTYGDVAPGRPLALVGSSGLLEIAVRDGSAAQALGVRVGDEVYFE